ncbi:putative DNA binding domain-containing protein [Methanomassiliicoccaceae archaeon COG_1]|nr:putative DNA binding domain-containing protein [Methanomassiliicoccaceae archaeon COG_1]
MKDEADRILEAILDLAYESEVVEFKDRKTLDKDFVGKYFSALSNEANLKGADAAWLVFGISDDGAVVDSHYLDTIESQNKLKEYIAEQTAGHVSFVDIHTKSVDGKRVLLFEIPPAGFGVPTSFKGFAYERQGDSLRPLSDEKRLRIMKESAFDWSRQIVPNAGIDVLDSDAISMAREYFIRNRPQKEDECKSWDDLQFLNKSKLTINGKVTCAAFVLLGKAECCDLIGDANPRMRWILRDNDRQTVDNEMFTVPFISSIERLCSKIRNVKYEYFRPSTLFPDRMDTYEPAMLREALNNCVAHQDYRMGEYITVVEYDRDRLVFSNAGSFIPGSIDAVLDSDSPASYYRNRFLAEAMFNLGMVDVAGGGIIKMFKYQRIRHFPMPEYDISGDHVKVTIYGKVTDKAFADTLMKNPRLGFEDVILLDKVQKGKPIPDADAVRLKAKGLIEGRKPNYILTAALAGSTDDRGIKGKTIKKKGFDDEYYCDLIIRYIEEYGSATKKDLLDLLIDKLPDVMDERKKINKVGNLIAKLKRAERIENQGTNRLPKYILVENSDS